MSKKIIGLLLAIAILFTACSSARAMATTSISVLSYGINGYNGFEKTLIRVNNRQALEYRIYPLEVSDAEILANLEDGSEAYVSVTRTITQQNWNDLLKTDSLAGIWETSKEYGFAEELCGTSTLIAVVATSNDQKTVGGFVTDDMYLYQMNEIVYQLSVGSGAWEQALVDQEHAKNEQANEQKEE